MRMAIRRASLVLNIGLDSFRPTAVSSPLLYSSQPSLATNRLATHHLSLNVLSVLSAALFFGKSLNEFPYFDFC